jgi:hypothetical protein
VVSAHLIKADPQGDCQRHGFCQWQERSQRSRMPLVVSIEPQPLQRGCGVKVSRLSLRL